LGIDVELLPICRMPFLSANQQHQSTVGTNDTHVKIVKNVGACRAVLYPLHTEQIMGVQA